jgi:hypothetical protein
MIYRIEIALEYSGVKLKNVIDRWRPVSGWPFGSLDTARLSA